MDSSGTKLQFEFAVHEPGTPYGYNNKCAGITVELVSETRRIAKVPLNKIDYAREIFFGVTSMWFNSDGTPQFDIFLSGKYFNDPRLNFNTYFSADKIGKLIMGKAEKH